MPFWQTLSPPPRLYGVRRQRGAGNMCPMSKTKSQHCIVLPAPGVTTWLVRPPVLTVLLAMTVAAMLLLLASVLVVVVVPTFVIMLSPVLISHLLVSVVVPAILLFTQLLKAVMLASMMNLVSILSLSSLVIRQRAQILVEHLAAILSTRSVRKGLLVR